MPGALPGGPARAEEPWEGSSIVKVREVANPTTVSFISEVGEVIIWNRYSLSLSYAASNEPGVTAVLMAGQWWTAPNLRQARTLARRWFKAHGATNG